MKRTLVLAMAAFFATGTAAMATTYSIQISNVCDHLTLHSTSGIIYGASDTSNCDTSIVVGNQVRHALTAAGDLGYGPTLSWIWHISLGRHGVGTATLTGTDGTNVFGPSNWSLTYTSGPPTKPPANRGLPSAISLMRR